jgi:hypothetical protein
MNYKGTLLPAVDSAQTGGLLDMGRNFNNFTIEVSFTGVITSCSFIFQGSLDKVNWYDLGSFTDTTSNLFHVANKPIRFVRGNLNILEGTTPTVTVKLITNEEPPS